MVKKGWRQGSVPAPLFTKCSLRAFKLGLSGRVRKESITPSVCNELGAVRRQKYLQ